MERFRGFFYVLLKKNVDNFTKVCNFVINKPVIYNTHTKTRIMKTFILQNYAGEKIGEVKRKNWNEVEYAVNHLNTELRKHYDLGIIDRSFLDKNVIGFIKGQKSTLAL